MENQLKENGISVEIPENIKRLSDNERVSFLHERLSAGKPIIILGERDGYEHYITLLGFDSKKDVFYVYDSFFPKGKTGLTVDNERLI